MELLGLGELDGDHDHVAMLDDIWVAGVLGAAVWQTAALAAAAERAATMTLHSWCHDHCMGSPQVAGQADHQRSRCGGMGVRAGPQQEPPLPPLAPMLAVTASGLPDRQELFGFEVTLDGFSCQLVLGRGQVRVRSRTGKPMHPGCQNSLSWARRFLGGG